MPTPIEKFTVNRRRMSTRSRASSSKFARTSGCSTSSTRRHRRSSADGARSRRRRRRRNQVVRGLASVFEGFISKALTKDQRNAFRHHRKEAGHVPRFHGRRGPRAGHRPPGRKCQVVAHRTQEKNGYTALQLGVGKAKVKNVSKAERGRFAVAHVEPKMRLAEFRVEEDKMIPVGAEITADHFAVGQYVDVTGVTIGRALPGPMKRWNFRGFRATHGVLIRTFASVYRRPSGSGQDLEEQEDGRPHGCRSGDDAEPSRCPHGSRARPDPGRRRGARSRWRVDRSARRGEEAVAKDAPLPGKFRVHSDEAAAEPSAEAAKGE